MSTFAKLIEAYREDCLAREMSPSTVVGKLGMVRVFAGWCLANGVANPKAVTLKTLEDYRKHLYQHHKRRDGRPIDVPTRRNHLTAVTVFLRRLKRLGHLAKDPGAEFEMPRVERRLTQVWLTEDEAATVCKQAALNGRRGVRDVAMLEVLFATGVRRIELVRLDIKDVDFEARTLKVRKGKGGHSRYVPIAERACEAIKRYLAEVRPELVTLQSGQALFLDNRGNRFRVQQASRLVGRYVALSGVQKRGACNLFRHSTATLMLENGADIRHIQKMLGHRHIGTTEIYTHVAIGSLKKVYANTHPAARRSGGAPAVM